MFLHFLNPSSFSQIKTQFIINKNNTGIFSSFCFGTFFLLDLNCTLNSHKVTALFGEIKSSYCQICSQEMKPQASIVPGVQLGHN